MGSCQRCVFRAAPEPHANSGSSRRSRSPEALHDARMQETLVIVDDHALFRSIAREKLEADGIQVLGEAADGRSGLEAIAALRPTIVLVDIHLPDIDGFAVAERLAAWPSPPKVVLISSRESSAYGARLTHAAVLGFLAKRELSGAALAALVD